jgi:hypothetical protein
MAYSLWHETEMHGILFACAICHSPLALSRMRGNSVYTQYAVGIFHIGVDVNKVSGCSKRLSSKAAASEDRRRTLWGTLRI